MYRLNTHQILIQQHAQSPTFRKMVQRGHPITATQIPSISTITLCNNQKPDLDGKDCIQSHKLVCQFILDHKLKAKVSIFNLFQCIVLPFLRIAICGYGT